jgi:hypothetical protein
MKNVECRMKNEESGRPVLRRPELAAGFLSSFFIPHSTFDISVSVPLRGSVRFSRRHERASGFGATMTVRSVPVRP